MYNRIKQLDRIAQKLGELDDLPEWNKAQASRYAELEMQYASIEHELRCEREEVRYV